MITLASGWRADEPAGGLETAEARHADVHEDEVGLLVREAGEHLLAARGGLDAVDAGDAGHELAQSLADDAVVVADQHGGHRSTSGRTAWRWQRAGQRAGAARRRRGWRAGRRRRHGRAAPRRPGRPAGRRARCAGRWRSGGRATVSGASPAARCTRRYAAVAAAGASSASSTAASVLVDVERRGRRRRRRRPGRRAARAPRARPWAPRGRSSQTARRRATSASCTASRATAGSPPRTAASAA